ncbi:MAG: ABC transporter substrate-binding protein [Oscillospiraceae bacterium]|jgi:iron complex transport system substrate-binding protein|nr:ABC transporter substrate-binding protein [Oscillospiraceae bacterium]
MRLRVTALILALALLLALAACGSPVKYGEGVETYQFTDSAGRRVELPRDITRVAPSGQVATMLLSILCPEYMVCVSGTPSSSQYKYLPENLLNLPTTGQLYGSKSTINLESLIDAAPQIIIDLGDRKDSIASDMDSLQKTTGIATVFVEADLNHMSAAYRTLGELFDLRARAETLADFIDETMSMAAGNSAKLADGDVKTVMFTSGTSGLNTNASGSVQAQVLDILNIKNAVVVEDISNAGGGNTIDMEQLYNFAPEIIIFAPASIYGKVADMAAWAQLPAIKTGDYYEIPGLPYNWMSGPPSVNMILGVWWLGNLVYPALYDYDMVEVAQKIYRLFWGYELTGDEARAMLANSTLKDLQ